MRLTADYTRSSVVRVYSGAELYTHKRQQCILSIVKVSFQRLLLPRECLHLLCAIIAFVVTGRHNKRLAGNSMLGE